MCIVNGDLAVDSSLSHINGYMAVDGSGCKSTNNLRAVIAARLNASHISRYGVGLNRSAGDEA